MKKIINIYLLLLLLLLFFAGNYSASKYGKELINVFIYSLPYNLKISKVDAKYALYNSETDLAVIFPEEEFSLDKNIYVEEIEKYCEFKDFIALQIRTNDNTIKVLSIWIDNDKLQSNVYDTKEFYNKHSDFVGCIGLEHTPYIVKVWSILGYGIIIAILLLLYFIWIPISSKKRFDK